MMLVASLRACGGRLAASELVVVSPRNRPLSARTSSFLRDHNCHLEVLALNTKHSSIALANKPYAAAWLAGHTRQLWFLDSDTLIVDDCSDLFTLLNSTHDLILRPVWPGGFKCVGSLGPHDANDGFWRAAYALTEAKVEPMIEVPWQRARIRGYWNSGVILSRDNNIYADWLECFLTMYANKLVPQRPAYLEQVALAFAAARHDYRISWLEGTNVSLEQIRSVPKGRLRIIHYAGPAKTKLSVLPPEQAIQTLIDCGIHLHPKGGDLLKALRSLSTST
jgi:hypothetical protein